MKRHDYFAQHAIGTIVAAAVVAGACIVLSACAAPEAAPDPFADYNQARCLRLSDGDTNTCPAPSDVAARRAQDAVDDAAMREEPLPNSNSASGLALMQASAMLMQQPQYTPAPVMQLPGPPVTTSCMPSGYGGFSCQTH